MVNRGDSAECDSRALQAGEAVDGVVQLALETRLMATDALGVDHAEQLAAGEKRRLVLAEVRRLGGEAVYRRGLALGGLPAE